MKDKKAYILFSKVSFCQWGYCSSMVPLCKKTGYLIKAGRKMHVVSDKSLPHPGPGLNRLETSTWSIDRAISLTASESS